jgi:hypothetical protein
MPTTPCAAAGARIALARTLLSISAPEYVEDPTVTDDDVLAQPSVQDALDALDHAWPQIAQAARDEAR